MNPRIARVDANQHAIVKALRWRGATVQHLHTVGDGCPDIVVGFLGFNILMEIKAEAGKLTRSEHEWHHNWRGTVYVVRSPDEALDILDYVAEHGRLPIVT